MIQFENNNLHFVRTWKTRFNMAFLWLKNVPNDNLDENKRLCKNEKNQFENNNIQFVRNSKTRFNMAFLWMKNVPNDNLDEKKRLWVQNIKSSK